MPKLISAVAMAVKPDAQLCEPAARLLFALFVHANSKDVHVCLTLPSPPAQIRHGAPMPALSARYFASSGLSLSTAKEKRKKREFLGSKKMPKNCKPACQERFMHYPSKMKISVTFGVQIWQFLNMLTCAPMWPQSETCLLLLLFWLSLALCASSCFCFESLSSACLLSLSLASPIFGCSWWCSVSLVAKKLPHWRPAARSTAKKAQKAAFRKPIALVAAPGIQLHN